jgi:HEAT repeat protein
VPPTTRPPTTLAPPTAPPVTPPDAPVTGPETPGRRGAPRTDDTTWETWWELNRFEFLNPRFVTPVTTPRPGADPADATLVRSQVWPLLEEKKSSTEAMMRTATMVTTGRVGAVSPGFAAAARGRLLEAIHDSDRRVARAAIRGLVHVADPNLALPLHREAAADHPHDVRGFLTLTIPARENAATDSLLASLWKGDEGGNFEITTLAALGHSRGPAGDRILREVLADAKTRPELRSTAATSLARRGGDDVPRLLLAALDDRQMQVRRAAAMGLGVLDWRTAAEREIDALRREAASGQAPAADFAGRLALLGSLVEPQQEAVDGLAHKVIRRLARAVDRDRDRFVRSMALVSIGRIGRDTESTLARTVLEREYSRNRHAQREFALLALALSRAPEAHDAAVAELGRPGAAPTTRGAAAVALGLLADPRADEVLLRAMNEDAHPTIRGYAALALGMIGSETSGEPLRAFVATARSPESIGWGALGLSLLGRRQDTALLVRRLADGATDVIGWNLVHALRLNGDRSALPHLLALAKDARSDVAELAVLATGYVVSRDAFPQRIRMSRGYDYTLRHLTLDAYYFTL